MKLWNRSDQNWLPWQQKGPIDVYDGIILTGLQDIQQLSIHYTLGIIYKSGLTLAQNLNLAQGFSQKVVSRSCAI